MNNIRIRKVGAVRGLIKLDSLSIIPGSLKIYRGLSLLMPDTLYHVDFRNATVILPQGSDSLEIIYRVFPFHWDRMSFHKNRNDFPEDKKTMANPFSSRLAAGENPFQLDGLSKSGSISRGISIGNQQDVTVNSNFNLQISGKIAEDVDILAAISDNNLPVQPEGNTQQLQEFDKVFIQLSKNKTRLIVGDFELKSPPAYFMKYSKKLQGVELGSEIVINPAKEGYKSLSFSLSGANTRGKYARNQINGIESNQGPYKLTGNNLESFLVVLSGSEKVYIDGQLKVRGQDQDYIIDYNLAEITFTAKTPITKDKRIVVEFEYTDKHYGHSAYAGNLQYNSPKTTLSFLFFSEQDTKSQSIQPQLTDAQKAFMGNLGDQLGQAFFPASDSVTFSADEVLYKRQDSLIGGIRYDSVYIYSIHPDSAHFRLSFTYMGPGKGHYLLQAGMANARVFYWVAPVNGILQGAYEPIVYLVTPKQKQMYSLILKTKLSSTSLFEAEAALSNQDLNTFSGRDKNNDIGGAIKLGLQKNIAISRQKAHPWDLEFKLTHEYSSRFFDPIENYRPIEFNRDFNLLANLGQREGNFSFANISLSDHLNTTLAYQLKLLSFDQAYTGWNHDLVLNFAFQGILVKAKGSLLTTRLFAANSSFLRLNADISKSLGWLKIGATRLSEDNAFKNNGDSLQANSYAFHETGVYMKTDDSLAHVVELKYKHRTDYLPRENSLVESANADDVSASYQLLKQKHQSLLITTTYRQLTFQDASMRGKKPENTLLGRMEYQIKIWKDILTSNTLYEVGSGLENKKSYSFVKVANGQGLYCWIDYNQNGIPELNEFETAQFKDQGNYIKIYTQTNEYEKVNYNQFTENLILNPPFAWSTLSGLRKFFSRFYNQFTFKTEQKTTSSQISSAYNPFEKHILDSLLLFSNQTFRNIFSINRTSSVWNLDFIYQQNASKALLLNGVERKNTLSSSCKLKTKIFANTFFTLEGIYSEKSAIQELFPERKLQLFEYDLNPELHIQPSHQVKIEIAYGYSHKRNAVQMIPEVALLHKGQFGLSIKSGQQGSLMMSYSFVSVSYNAAQNTSVSYEMLEGLLRGSNHIWSLTYQQYISGNLQLSFIYDGRKSQSASSVHTGNVQLRAFF